MVTAFPGVIHVAPYRTPGRVVGAMNMPIEKIEKQKERIGTCYDCKGPVRKETSWGIIDGILYCAYCIFFQKGESMWLEDWENLE